MTDSTVEPPYSRLFILCSKTISEEDLKDAFSKYGSIEDIWIVKDKTTNENKGVVYIKFNKTSEAALAMEELNGKMMPSSQKPLKIMVAHSREQGSRRDDDSERLLRLFIVVPRNATEDEIRDHFKQFGDVDYVSIVRNRETGESKGFAYVKYTKPVGAARAFEECSRTYKAVYARPKEQKPTHQSQYEAVGSGVERFYSGGAGGGPQPLLGAGGHLSNGGDKWGGGGEGGGSTRLTALVSPNLREQHIFRLFDLIPGLQLCRPIHERSYNGGMQKILLQYSSPQFAQHAFEKLNGFEYPIGHRITVKMEPPQPMSLMDGPGDRSGRGGFNSQGGGSGGGGMKTISSSELDTLTTALAKAEAIIKAAGLGPGVIGESGNTFDPSYCSAKLPSPKPLASTTETVERLFIVCQPGLPPMYALRDVFGRFGNLVEVYVLNGKNCGYVSYASKESALEAIETLHLQEVCGMRLKVMKAEPPPGGPSKRIKVDDDGSN